MTVPAISFLGRNVFDSDPVGRKQFVGFECCALATGGYVGRRLHGETKVTDPGPGIHFSTKATRVLGIAVRNLTERFLR